MEASTACTTTQFGELVGKYIKHGGEKYEVEEVGSSFAICVHRKNATKLIRIRTSELQTARMKHVLASFTPNKSQKFPLEFIKYVIARLREAKQKKEDIKLRQKAIKKVKKRRRTLEEKQKTLDSRHEFGKEITQKSLDNQFESLKKSEEAVSELPESGQLLSQKTILDDIQQVYGVRIPEGTAKNWLWKEPTENVGGRPRIFPTEIEDNIINAMLHLDSIGFSVSREMVLNLVEDYVGEDFKKKFKNGVVTVNWFNRFIARAKKKNPEIVTAIGQRCQSLRDDWYNSANINWWFDTVKKRLLELCVAELVDGGDEGKEGEELSWKFPNRVIITDETKVPGYGDTRRNEPKLITTKQRLNENNKRPMSRPREQDEHITLLAGHSLTGDTTPPAWILPLKNEPNENVLIEMLKVVPTSNTLGKANGHAYHRPIIGNSIDGSVVKDNIKKIMEELIEIMFPDASDDDPSKRVIWFTDWHGSRCSSDFIKWLRSKGVYLFGWLPNCTSLMQSPDTNLFGPLKQVYMAVKRKELEHVSSTRYQRIYTMGKALAQVGTKQRYLEGLKMTGMLPFSRQTLLNKVQATIGDKKHAQKRKEKGKLLISRIHSCVSPCRSSNTQDEGTSITTSSAESIWSSISQRQAERGMELGPIATWKCAALTPVEIEEKKEQMLWRMEGFKGKLDHIEIGIDREHTKNIAALEYRKQQLENQLRQLENARTFKKEKLKAERVFCGDMQEKLKREQSTEELQSTVALCWESLSDMDQASRSSWLNTCGEGQSTEVVEVEGCDTSVISSALQRTAGPSHIKPKNFSYRPWNAGNLIRYSQTVEVTSSPNKRRIEELETKRDNAREMKRATQEAAEVRKKAMKEKAEREKIDRQLAVNNWLQSENGKYPGAPALKAWLKKKQVEFEATVKDGNKLGLVKTLLKTDAKQFRCSKQQFQDINNSHATP